MFFRTSIDRTLPYLLFSLIFVGIFTHGTNAQSIAADDTTSLQIIPAGNQNLCEGETLTLQASAGFTDYMWSTGDPGRALVVDKAGTYWVQAKNQQGQTVYSDTIAVAVFPLPEVQITALTDTVVCPQTAVTLAADPGFAAYEWSNGATTGTINVMEEGEYFVRVQNTGGCWGKSNTIAVAHEPAPNPAIEGDKQLCSSADPVKYYSQSAPWYYNEWSVVDGTIVGRNDRDTVYVQWNPEAQGTITIKQTESRTGCITSVTDTVIVRAIVPELNVSGDVMACGKQSVRLEASPIYDSYMWNTGAQTPGIDVTESGDYYVTITLANCIAQSDTIHVDLLNEITPDIDGPAIGCRDADVVYTATNYIGASYDWSIESGEIIAGQGTPTITVNWISLSPAKLRVDVQLDQCIAGDSMAVTVHQVQKPILTLEGSPNLCEGDTLVITATEGYESYMWSTGESTRSIRVTQSGAYSVEGFSATGCSIRSDTVFVTVSAKPDKPVINYSDSTLTCSVEADSYTWYLNGTVIPGASERTLVIHESGIYTVTVSNEAGCSNQSDAMTFTGLSRYAPSLASRFDVSPNPSNGTFTVALEFDAPQKFTARIVSITGQTIYERKSGTAQVSWNETIELPAPTPGMYFFIVESAGAWDYKKVVVR